MNRYIIKYHSKTRASLNKRKEQQTSALEQWSFHYPNLQDCELTIVMMDCVIKRDNVNLHTGLYFFVDITADSEEKAREISKESVEAILNLVSFCSSAYCDSAVLVSMITVSGEIHPFIYYGYQTEEQEILGSLVQVKKSTFDKIFEAYDKVDEKPRIQRALSWLRKGMGEEIHVDEFISYWVGLEVIKHVLSKGEKDSVNIWEKAKRILRRVLLKERLDSLSEWAKVKEIFKNELGFNNFTKIKRDGRNGLLHGFKQLDSSFMEKIRSYVEPIRKTLIYCIGNVLKLDKSIMPYISDKAPIKFGAFWPVIKGNLKNLPSDFYEIIQSHPTLDVNMFDKQYSINAEGALTMSGKTSHTFRSGSGIKLEGLEIELWGKKEAGIEEARLDAIDIKKSNELTPE